jgi:type IV secretory pathway VirB10-like protein
MQNKTILKITGITATLSPIVVLAYLAAINALTLNIVIACIIFSTIGTIAATYNLAEKKTQTLTKQIDTASKSPTESAPLSNTEPPQPKASSDTTTQLAPPPPPPPMPPPPPPIPSTLNPQHASMFAQISTGSQQLKPASTKIANTKITSCKNSDDLIEWIKKQQKSSNNVFVAKSLANIRASLDDSYLRECSPESWANLDRSQFLELISNIVQKNQAKEINELIKDISENVELVNEKLSKTSNNHSIDQATLENSIQNLNPPPSKTKNDNAAPPSANAIQAQLAKLKHVEKPEAKKPSNADTLFGNVLPQRNALLQKAQQEREEQNTTPTPL